MSNMLPADRYLASLLGISEEEYAYFKAEVQKRAADGPQPSVIAGTGAEWALALAIVNLVIGVGATIAATFFKPKPPEETNPAQLKVRNRGGKSAVENDRFVPRYGFDSAQDIATLGSVIPLVYANRETISGTIYGGVRVNTLLLWSQIQSLGGSQLLRAIFLIGEGPIASVDVQSFASGGNTLSSYDFGNATANQAGSRMSIYGRYLSGALTSRIASSHYIYGRSAANDIGNSVNAGGADVYQIRRNSTWASDFSAAMRPNSQTTFGVYSLIGNDFGMRINPTIKPKVQAQLIPEGDDGDAKVKCTVDDVAWAQRKKMRAYYSSRSGLVSGSVGSVGSTVTYKLLSSSDKDTAFSREIKTLTNEAAWNVSVTQVFTDSAGAFNKPINSDGEANQKGKWKFEYDSTNEIDLTSRVGATVVDVTVDSNGKGVLYANVTFNTTGGLWDEDVSNEQATANLEALKNSKFKVKFTNPVNSGIEDDEEIQVKFNLRVRVKHSGRQKFKMTDGSSSSSSSSSTSTDSNGNKTTTTSYVQTYTPPVLSVENIQYPVDFKVKNESPVTGGTLFIDGDDPGSGILSVNIALKFNAKTIHIEKCEDVAATVAGRQKAWDDAIIPGELYKIGSALAVCTARTGDDDAFVSEADLSSGSGTPVEATFTTVRAGTVTLNSEAQLTKSGSTWLTENEANSNPEWRNVATTDGHVLRCAIASISTTRACAAVEIGIRSRLGIRISNLCNFKDSISNDEADQRACLSREDEIVEEGSVLKVDNYQSNTLTTTVERYSFFSISYRTAGSTGAFTKLNNAYGIRSATQQNTFNSIQLNMPGTQQWEFQLEPYSGWEIRSGAGGTLYVIDSRLSWRLTVSEVNGITVAFNGESITRSADTFSINAGRRAFAKGSIGVPRADLTDYGNGDRSYIDTWGKLAEAFVYEEIQSSAANGPEHEVVYINEIVPNATAPVYDDLAIVGVNIMSSVEWQQFNQFSAYITGGKTCRRLLNGLSVGATHLFPDILLDLFTSTTYGQGDLIKDSMIDITSFQSAAQWCYDNRYFYDGALGERINLRQWAADTAATNLLIFGESNGKFFLRPALQTTAVTIKGLFTAGNIAENTFQVQYLDPEERDPIQVSVKYREERASSDPTNPGLFPIVREILVRDEGDPETASIESLDISDYCTSARHAIDAAKYIIRMRKIPTHTIRFNTTHEGVLSALSPGDYIRVALDITEYDEFNNGVVTAAGALVSTKALSDGAHNVIAWNGESATAPYDAVLAVSGNGTQATPTGIVFTVKLPSTQVRTYQIERISSNDDGTFTIEAVHMPTNSSGILDIAANIELGSTTSSAYWSISA